MAQPLDEIGSQRRGGAIVHIMRATLAETSRWWAIGRGTAGLQKCMSGPPGSAPTTFNDRVAEIVSKRKHMKLNRPDGFENADGPRISSIT